jgi:hypothetical protein
MEKSERHRIYKNILARVQREGWRYYGFCWFLREESGIDVYWESEFRTHFPEINKFRVIGRYWFDRHQGEDPKRESILKKAIKETKPKSNGISKRGGTKKRASLPSVRKRNSKKLGVVRRVRKKSKTS